MITPKCPVCDLSPDSPDFCPRFVRSGSDYRTSDSKTVQRFRCLKCGKYFSSSTGDRFYRKRERRKSVLVPGLLASGVSQRRAAYLLKIDRKTVARMLLIGAEIAREKVEDRNLKRGPISVIEFDDLETFEHTKCKPISVTLAVESTSRIILGFQVSRMPARGPLANFSREKYGFRPDERRLAREDLFEHLKLFAVKDAVFKSDRNPHYPPTVRKFFPSATHKAFPGRKPRPQGLGELKEGKFDPLFSLNHTCACFRANVNRLFRKTWCTTKRIDRLEAHLMIYADFHNQKIVENEKKALESALKGAS